MSRAGHSDRRDFWRVCESKPVSRREAEVCARRWKIKGLTPEAVAQRLLDQAYPSQSVSEGQAARNLQGVLFAVTADQCKRLKAVTSDEGELRHEFRTLSEAFSKLEAAVKEISTLQLLVNCICD